MRVSVLMFDTLAQHVVSCDVLHMPYMLRVMACHFHHHHCMIGTPARYALPMTQQGRLVLLLLIPNTI